MQFGYLCTTKILGMSFNDLFDSGMHKRNLGHFAALVTLASSDGEINSKEQTMLERLARKLDIDEQEYQEVLKTPGSFPINPPNTKELRFERLYDLFRIVYSDHHIDEEERILVKKYAIGLGFSDAQAQDIIFKSVKIFGGEIPIEDYIMLLERL